MLGHETLVELVQAMDEFDKERTLKSDKKYCVIYLDTFNAGHSTAIFLTDKPERLKNKNVEIVYLAEVQSILEES